MSELWKDIPGYEGLYQASNDGRIRTADGKTTSSARFAKRVWKQRILKPKACADQSKCGYRVTLWKDGKYKDYLVARIICATYHENLIDTDMTVNHKDGNRLNNHIDNVEWLTLADNIRHGFDTGLYKSNQSKITLVCNSVKREFASLAEASRFLGRNHGYIHGCIAKKRMARSIAGELYQVCGEI